MSPLVSEDIISLAYQRFRSIFTCSSNYINIIENGNNSWTCPWISKAAYLSHQICLEVVMIASPCKGFVRIHTSYEIDVSLIDLDNFRPEIVDRIYEILFQKIYLLPFTNNHVKFEQLVIWDEWKGLLCKSNGLDFLNMHWNKLIIELFVCHLHHKCLLPL